MYLLNLANEILLLIAAPLDITSLNSLLLTHPRLAVLLEPTFRKRSLLPPHAPAALLAAAATYTNRSLIIHLLTHSTNITILKSPSTRHPPIHTSPSPPSLQTLSHIRTAGADIVLKDGIALHWAVASRRKHLTTLLLDCGANINAIDPRNYMTALHAACQGPFGNEELITLLLDRGADISARDIYGSPALGCAVRENNQGAAKLLIARGADVNLHDAEGTTVLHVAASFADGELVKMLLSKGASVDSKDDGGMTALHIAASRGHEKAVRLLLENGADINAQDGRKWSPLHLAALGGTLR